MTTIKDNPIFSGEIGVYNSVRMHESSDPPPDVCTCSRAEHKRGRKAVRAFATRLGVCATCSKKRSTRVPNFVREFARKDLADWYTSVISAGNALTVTPGVIHGLKKSTFNSINYATVTATSEDPGV